MIAKAPHGLARGLLTPIVCLLWDTRLALKPLNNEDGQKKTVKSMTVSHTALICSSQSSKVAPLTLLVAPTSTGKKKKKYDLLKTLEVREE